MIPDAIQFQEFKQISDTNWDYDIISRNKIKYKLQYIVLKTGFIRERLFTDNKMLYDREFRCGERLVFTFEDVIAHFGNVSQAMSVVTQTKQ